MIETIKENKLKHKLTVLVDKQDLLDFVSNHADVKIEGDLKAAKIYLNCYDFSETPQFEIETVTEDRLKLIESKKVDDED